MIVVAAADSPPALHRIFPTSIRLETTRDEVFRSSVRPSGRPERRSGFRLNDDTINLDICADQKSDESEESGRNR